MDSNIWLKEKFTRGQAWVDLLMLANHKEGYIRKRGIRVDLCRGDIGWSERELSKRWKWSRDKVRRFLNELCAENESKLIPQNKPQKKNITSCYKIINYNLYQDGQTTEPTTNKTTNRPQTGHKQDQNKNDKNVKNDKNIYKRAKSLSENFDLDEKLRQYAIEKNIIPDKIDELFESFRDYHLGNGTKKKDWSRAWYTWVRNAPEFSKWAYKPPEKEKDDWRKRILNEA